MTEKKKAGRDTNFDPDKFDISELKSGILSIEPEEKKPSSKLDVFMLMVEEIDKSIDSGISFEQIKSYLDGKGFELELSTLKNYYSKWKTENLSDDERKQIEKKKRSRKRTAQKSSTKKEATVKKESKPNSTTKKETEKKVSEVLSGKNDEIKPPKKLHRKFQEDIDNDDL